MKKLVLLIKRAIKFLVRYVLLIILIALLIYTTLNLIWGISCPCLTMLANSVPYPERLRSPDGIGAVIAALGMVGFALSYINSARNSRVKGILMEQVISQCWPRYGFVFLIHGILALLGLYSCQVHILNAAWTCLTGILLCTAYSLCMAYSIHFSWKSRERLIAQYLEELLYKRRSFRACRRNTSRLKRHIKSLLREILPPKVKKRAAKFKQKKFSYTEGRRMAYQLGRYIGERYQSEDFQLDQSSDDVHMDKQLLQSALELLKPWPNMLGQDKQTQDKQPHKTWEGPLSEVFDRMLLDKTVFPGGPPGPPKDIILLSNIPWSRAFRAHIFHCATLWDNLLRPVERDGKQAKLAADVLLNASETAALCCGLVLHLHTRHIQSSNDTEGWQFCSSFLSRIANLARTSDNTAWHGNRNKVLRCCMDMILLFICLACLQGANSMEICTALDTILIELFITERRKNAGPNCYMPINAPFLTKYLYFAHIIFLMLAISGATVPFQPELNRQITAIAATLEHFLDKNLLETITGGMDHGKTTVSSI